MKFTTKDPCFMFEEVFNKNINVNKFYVKIRNVTVKIIF